MLKSKKILKLKRVKGFWNYVIDIYFVYKLYFYLAKVNRYLASNLPLDIPVNFDFKRRLRSGEQ